MQLKHIKSLQLSKAIVSKMTMEVRNEYEVFLENQLMFFRDFFPTGYESLDDTHNILLAIVEGEIVAFRYFYFHNRVCELFNTYVDSANRRQSIATQLIEDSIHISHQNRLNKFVIRMASENAERTGLYHKYKVLGNHKFNTSQFTIYYAGKEAVIG